MVAPLERFPTAAAMLAHLWEFRKAISLTRKVLPSVSLSFKEEYIALTPTRIRKKTLSVSTVLLFTGISSLQDRTRNRGSKKFCQVDSCALTLSPWHTLLSVSHSSHAIFSSSLVPSVPKPKNPPNFAR